MIHLYHHLPSAKRCFLTLIICSFLGFTGSAQFSGTSTSAGTITTTSVAQGFAWTNPNNVQTQDNIFATSNITGANRSTFFLDAQNWGFQSTNNTLPNYIPPGATINGIEVEVRHRKSGTGNIRDRTIQLLKGGSTTGTNKANNNYWPVVSATARYGSNVDLWGATWTATDLTATNFGVRIQARNQGSRDAQAEIDHVRITVYFNQTFFYSKSTGNLETTGTWGLATDGSGSAPSNFTTAGQVFFLVNRATATLTAPLTISGTNSRLIIGNGTTATTLTVPSTFALTASVNIAALSGLTINNTTNPTLSSIGTGTTVTYGASANQTVQDATYFNLTLSGSGTKTMAAAASQSITVNNVLNIASGVTLNNNGNRVLIGGATTGIVNNGTASGSGRYTYALLDASTNISGTGTYSNLDIDFTTSSTTRTLTITNPITVTDTLFAGEGTIANSTNLTMNPASVISVREGILSGPLSSTGYDVVYNPFTGTSPKATGNELSGTIRNLLVRPGAGLTLNLNRNLTLGGYLEIASGTLDITTSNYTVNVAGNYLNNGTFVPRNGSVVFNGTANQSLGGTGTHSFYNLGVNKAGGGLLLQAPATVSNTLTLTSGNVSTTVANTLTLGASATAVSGGSTSSYVNGPLAKIVSSASANYTFPVGDIAYRPATLSVTQAVATPTTYTLQSISGAPATRTLPAGINRVSTVRYHSLSSSNAGNLTGGTITLNYGTGDGVTDPASLRIARASGTNWVNVGGTGSATETGTITSTTLGGTGDFVLANVTGGTNALPLTWLEFTGMLRQGKAELRWVTTDEVNVILFQVERSGNGTIWQSIGTVAATRENGRNTYTFTDITPLSQGLYRIKSVDMDGRESLSAIVRLASAENEGSLSIAPNPVTGQYIKIVVAHPQMMAAGEWDIQITDWLGRTHLKNKIAAATEVELNGFSLPAGKYIIIISGNGHTLTGQFIMQ